MRTRFVLLLAGVFVVALATLCPVGVGAAPVPAGTPVKIAVPVFVPVDGQLDMVVFTKAASETIDGSTCFGGLTLPVHDVVIVDKTSGQHGRVSDVLADREYGPGTRITQMVFAGTCSAPTGVEYKTYDGVAQQ